MKQPENREVETRSEMVCPRCSTEGLEENPAYMDEYTGRTAIKKATRCPNEDCKFHKGIPPEKVEMQMANRSIFDVFTDLLSNIISKENAKVGIVVLLGVSVIFMQVGIYPFNETDPVPKSNITGEFEGNFSASDSVVELYQNGERINTTPVNQTGTYTFVNITEGAYTIVPNSNSNTTKSPPEKQVSITTNGTVNVSTPIQHSIETFEENTIENEGNQTVNLTYRNRHNIQDINVSLSPLPSQVIERSPSVSQSEDLEFSIPVPLQAQQVRVDVPTTEQNRTVTKQYLGSSGTFSISGNREAEYLDISLTNDSISPQQTRSVRVNETTDETIYISSNQTAAPVSVTLDNGTGTSGTQETGTWEQGDGNITTETGREELVEGTVILESIPQTETVQKNGTLTGSTESFTVEGNTPVEDAAIEFTGGEAVDDFVTDQSVSASGEGGTSTETALVQRVSESGTYRIDYTPNAEQNEDLMNYWYEINGERTNISEQGFETVQLQENDEVQMGMKAQLETLGPEESPHDSDNPDVRLRSINVGDNVEAGDITPISADVTNVGESTINREFTLYINGEADFTQSVSISPDQTKNINFGERVIPGEGTNVLHVNSKEPKYVHTTDPTFGSGSFTVELNSVGDSGTVKVDTTGDGILDCSVTAIEGTCEFQQLQPGENIFEFEEEGVSATEYNITYTSVRQPENIELDISDNGITDVSQSGVLNGSESYAVELPSGEFNTTASMDSQNTPFEYAFVWESEQSIVNPAIYVDGEPVLTDTGEFEGPRTFNLNVLDRGEHTIQFRTGEGGYDAQLEWLERSEAAYPQTKIDNVTVCEPSDYANTETTCSVTGEEFLQPGEHTIDFSRGDNEFSYQVKHGARAIASTISLKINDEVQTLNRPSTRPEPWSEVRSTDGLKMGNNVVSAEIPVENNIQPEANIEIPHSFNADAATNVQVTVENANGTYTYEPPEENVIDNELRSATNITIPEEDLIKGKNTLKIETDIGVVQNTVVYKS